MSFLSKLGNGLKQGLNIAGGLFPIISPIISTIKPDLAPAIQKVGSELTAIAGLVTLTEGLVNAPGSQKLEAVSPLVTSLLKQGEFMSGKEIANDALFAQGAKKITDGMADILNSLSENSVKVAR